MIKNKMPQIIMAGLGAALVVMALYNYSSMHLSEDSRLVFSSIMGVIIGFGLIQNANMMTLRDELEKIKAQLAHLKEYP